MEDFGKLECEYHILIDFDGVLLNVYILELSISRGRSIRVLSPWKLKTIFTFRD